MKKYMWLIYILTVCFLEGCVTTKSVPPVQEKIAQSVEKDTPPEVIVPLRIVKLFMSNPTQILPYPVTTEPEKPVHKTPIVNQITQTVSPLPSPNITPSTKPLDASPQVLPLPLAETKPVNTLIADNVEPKTITPASKPISEVKPSTTPVTTKVVQPLKVETTKQGAPLVPSTQNDVKKTVASPEPPVIKPPVMQAPASTSSAMIVPENKNVSPLNLLQEGRKVIVPKGNAFEIPFDSTSWIYQGEETFKDGIVYQSRKFQGNSAIVVLAASKVGVYRLIFGKIDTGSNVEKNEIIEVTVTEDKASALSLQNAYEANKVVPVNATVSKPTASLQNVPDSANAPQQNPSLGTTKDLGIIQNLDTPEALLLYAKNELGKNNIESTVKTLELYLSKYPEGSDEVLYLLGKIYEMNTPYKNIKKSYAFYSKVKFDYPESKFWEESDKRMIYIERHYLDIR